MHLIPRPWTWFGVQVDSQIPPYTDPGDRWVFVAKAPGSREEAISSTFRVTGAGETPPARDVNQQRDTEITVSGRLIHTGTDCPAIRERSGQLYSLSGADLNAYDSGDQLTVTGRVVEDTGCEQGTALQVAELRGPEDGNRDDDDGSNRRIIGTVTDQGVECPALRARDGTLYILTGSGVEQLQPGQRVYVEGTEVEISFCQQGTTLAVKRVEERGRRRN